MFVVHDLGLAIAFCVLTMLGWGSWANTQKLAGTDKWPFQLYYWDYALGVFVLGLVFLFTLGSFGASGMSGIENLSRAGGWCLRVTRSGRPATRLRRPRSWSSFCSTPVTPLTASGWISWTPLPNIFRRNAAIEWSLACAC